jgi:hypothetical protein
MTILDILNRFASAGDGLVAFLTRAGAAAPDLKPKADEWIARLQEAVSLKNLTTLASVLPGEIANIAQGKLEPRSHPSDSA